MNGRRRWGTSGRRATGIAALLAIAALAVAGIASADTHRIGSMLVQLTARLAPKRLPREGQSPIAVTVGWKISTVDGSEPATLKSVKIQINHNGILDPTGLPTCPYSQIHPASTARALKNCRSSLVGTGNFSARVGLEGQENYDTHGKMVVFNSVQGGKPTLFGQIYTAYPFAASFVIPFKVSKGRHGSFGTTLDAKLPASLVNWGNLTEVNMRLSRKFAYRGHPHSFLRAGCPTPAGVPTASFPLAKTDLDFIGGAHVSSTLSENCRVRH
jgi:hypothetical protein